jgi:hypothetical protein
LVPVRNGAFPEVPAGGHRSHVGTLLEAAPVALPADPAELAEEEEVDRTRVPVVEGAGDVLVVPPPVADTVPVPAAPEGGAAVVVPVAVEDVDCAVVPVAVFPPAVVAVALLPSVTTPRFVTLYWFAAVCATAGAMAAKKNSTV